MNGVVCALKGQKYCFTVAYNYFCPLPPVGLRPLVLGSVFYYNTTQGVALG